MHASLILDLPSRDCVPVLPLDVSIYQINSPFYTGISIRDWAIATSRELKQLLSAVSPSVSVVGFRAS